MHLPHQGSRHGMKEICLAKRNGKMRRTASAADCLLHCADVRTPRRNWAPPFLSLPIDPSETYMCFDPAGDL
ncbi:hypothetical protein VTK56DRAFT_7735 [Thermocarpiscus australiensis]